MAASLLSLSSPASSTATPHLHPLSSHFKGNARTLRANPCPFPSVKLCHHRAKQRQPLVVLNSAASGVQESVASNQNVRFRLDNLGPQPGSRKKAKRKGRGHSAGQGGSCGYGMRGQKSRSGPGVRKGFEGGQMHSTEEFPSMHAGLPKYVPVNLKDIADAGFEEGEEVSLESLKKKGLINPSGREKETSSKGDGELNVKLNLKAWAFSAAAKEKLEAAGCSLTVLPGRKKWVKPSVAKNLARAEEYFAKKRAASDSVDSPSA
ncbi:50S ribosomal protein L15, chloroplastic [Sesamum angolense]|uniref:50S ribosomal protein L15, chloroplastic n=1 Tax=Sesamum angolense TaxID=2727404 RepID=A0AAE1WUL9_9LAMI|nr:50S ribosomal protein L15, chloroplastic [Sesamum angolense]